MRHILAPATLALALSTMPAFSAPEVLASIKPVHSLVAAVMQGVGEPGLIVEGAGSPHAYSLKPSQAAAIEDAQVIFWIGPELEAFLVEPIETIGAGARAVSLVDTPGLTRLEFREGGAFESHDHAHEGEEGHEGHAHGEDHAHDDGDHEEAHDDQGNHAHDEAHAEGDHAHEDHAHDHDHEGFDSHVWLDPENARAMVAAIEENLAEIDPDNAETYAKNAERVTEELGALMVEVEGTLAPVRGKPFIVFHDAYHYFENRFGVEASGSITVSPDVMPGAARVEEIREHVRELGAACVFTEPQFEPRIVSVVTEGTDARSGVLDPLGAALPDGPDLYFELILDLAGSMRTCLTEAG